VAFDFVPELYRKFMVCSIIIGRLVYLMKLIFDTILISYQALLCCTAAAASRLLMCDLVPYDRSSQHPSSSTPRVTLLCLLTNPSIRSNSALSATAALPETSTISPEVDTFYGPGREVRACLWLSMAKATNRRLLGKHFQRNGRGEEVWTRGEDSL
jgi:hypothetical protein